MINRALKYLERGLVPIPLVHRTKTPAIPWREFFVQCGGRIQDIQG